MGTPSVPAAEEKHQLSRTKPPHASVLHTAVSPTANSQQGPTPGQQRNSELHCRSWGNASCYRFPLVEPLVILVPTDLKADGVPSHLGEVWCC